MTRTRERETGMGLLPRMEARPGKKATSYRYHPVNGKPIALGTNLADAIRKVLDLLGRAPDTGTVKWVWEKYKESPRFKKRATRTRKPAKSATRRTATFFRRGLRCWPNTLLGPGR